MRSLVAFNAVMVVAGMAVTTLIPAKVLIATLYWFHVSLGITAPTPKNARFVALIWIVSIAAIVDVLALLLVWLT